MGNHDRLSRTDGRPRDDEQRPVVRTPSPGARRLWSVIYRRGSNLLRRWPYIYYPLSFLLAFLLLVHAARLVFQPDPHDQLRRADALFQTGHYYAALQSYISLAEQEETPEMLLRLGMVRAVRGEHIPAERSLLRALGGGLRGETHDLGALYLGHVLDRRGESRQALAAWDRLARTSPLDGVRRVLRAEVALRRGDYAAAEADYRAALGPGLPDDWRALVVYRLALLRAASDPGAALVEVITGREQPALAPAQAGRRTAFLQPLLPYVEPDTDRLLAILRADAAERSQLLGQLYLDHNLFALAEAQFAQVAHDSPNALAAAAYAAYTRWLAGDTEGGMHRLEDLVATYPDEPRARTLLALVYLSQENAAAARAQIDTIATMAPAAPDTHLAWANWYVAQRDYVQASTEYQRALSQAPPEQRGSYALLVARFHLTTTYRLCQNGLPAAETAAEMLGSNAEAWTTLAASRYYCGEFAGAVAAARRALSATPDADAAFYLGSALAALGQWDAARRALVDAADLAPASVWRERAEERLAQLPVN